MYLSHPRFFFKCSRVITEGPNVALIELAPREHLKDRRVSPGCPFPVSPNTRDEWFMDVLQQMGALSYHFEASDDRRILDIMRELVIAIQLYSKFNLDQNHCGLWFRKQLQAAKEFYVFYCENHFF